MTAPALSTRSLDKSFGSLAVARDVELSLPHGERYALIGPNGAGKTTLINLITGMLKPDGGRIFLGDDERAEPLLQVFGGERRRGHGLLASLLRPRAMVSPGARRARPPRMPLGRKITTATSKVPIQKYQYCGLTPENWSRATM